MGGYSIRPYTDEEIRASYRQAEKKKQQIEILADLNLCSVDDIREIIFQEEGKLMGAKKPDWDVVCAYIESGHGVDEAAAKYGLSVARINRTLGIRKNKAQKVAEPQPQPASRCIIDEYARIKAVLDMAQGDDSERVKHCFRNLVNALADQMATRAIPMEGADG